MPPLTREEFNRIRQTAIESAPEGLTREQFQARLDAMLQATEEAKYRVPGSDLDEQRDKAYNESLSDTGMRTVRGITRGVGQALNPVNIAKGLYETGEDILTNRGRGTMQGIGDTASAIASGDPDAGGEMIGNLLVGGAAGRAGQIGSAARRGLSTTADLGWAATKGAAGNAPIVGPMGRGAIKGVRDRLARKADISGGRLMPKNEQSIRSFTDDIERALAENLDSPTEPITRGGSASGRSSARGVTLEPERLRTSSGEMVATRPTTKWGTTSVHSADDLEAALRSPQGQLRSSDVASPYMMRKRGVTSSGSSAIPEESVSSIQAVPDEAASFQRPSMDDTVARYLKGDPQRQRLLDELLRAERESGRFDSVFQRATQRPSYGQ